MLGNKLTSFLVLLQSVSLPNATSSWPWNVNDATPQKIRPKITRPSGPTNVNLYVVSRTELGVAWDPPLFDGGKAISKYLVEWDSDKYMTSGIASPSNPYDNNVDGPLVRSEVVWGKTDFRITGLIEGQKYYVRVSAYGDGYSNAISTSPPYAIPSVTLPGYLTDVSLSIATDTDTADRLRLAWSAAEVDVNGFSVLPNGCVGGASPTPPSSPDPIEAYRVQWDTHPSFSNAITYDIPAVSGDGVRNHCCPSGSTGVCHVELGAEAQTVSIMHPASSVSLSDDLFDSGGIRIAYVGSQSKSIKIETPSHGSTEIRISASSSLPLSSPINVGDLMRIRTGVYLVSDVDNYPTYITLASEYQSGHDDIVSATIQAYFSTPPSTCFDVSGMGNSAESFRTHIAQNFDNSLFDESISVSRSTLTEPFAGSSDQRIVGYEYHVTFVGQGFSSTMGHSVDDLIIISKPSSPFFTVGSCSDPFVSSGSDVSSQVSLSVATKMDSGSLIPGLKYYVQVAGVNSVGAGPFVSATPESEAPKSLSGLAQDCRIYALPSSSSSLKVEWEGVKPFHGQAPNSYRIEFYDMDSGSSTPAAIRLVAEIDESSPYSIIATDLTPGVRYRANVIPINDLGEGSPSWFSSFDSTGLIHDDTFSLPQDYTQQSCNAVPTCEASSVECAETESSTFTITTRSVPPPPITEVGTYPSVSNKNRFSAHSTLISFQSPMADNSFQSTGIPTDKFRIEWSTSPSFHQIGSGGSTSFWSVEVAASYLDGANENAFGDYKIDSLEMGTQYYVRVFAHNSAGYGSPSISVPVKPMTRPDPPYEPILSSVSLESIESSQGLSENAVIGTSLYVSWQPSRVDSANGRPDLVGNGGDTISSYLVEWSRLSFDSYNPTIVEVSIKTSAGISGSSASGLLSGSFQILVDTTISPETAVRGSYSSASIPVDSSGGEIKTIIENMPNVGEVNVHSSEPFTWILTFLSEVGDIGISVNENNVIDDSLAAGIVDITKLGTGSVPANAAYGFEVVENFDALTPDQSIHYTIKHLVPGMQIFTRVSAANQVGYGPRRKTAPEFISPALQRPEQATSLYNDEAPPHLSVHSPTSLQVHIGPPSYDGGSPLTTFLVEWDLLPSFSSSLLKDGSALGSARVNAASRICALCVTDFDLFTHTFSYNGDEDMATLLIPQRKIMVFFSDDNTHYLFSIISASSSAITVSDKHLRVSSLHNMKNKAGNASSDLDILGANYIIGGLIAGKTYYVRVSSENGEGTGKSIATNPHHETPRGFPAAPNDVTVGVKDKNTLEVSWSDSSYKNNPDIQAFRIERYCKSDAASSVSFSFFGEQEVVEFSSVGLGLTGGSFIVYFGDFDTSSVFLGHAKTTNGQSYVETFVDFTAHLDRGESILIDEEEYSVHPTESFTASRLPLLESYSGENSESAAVYSRSKSTPISFDASAEEVRNALERMPDVNHVHVRREIVEGSDGYQWFVTFISNVGPQPTFSVDTTFLVGTNPMAFSVSRSVAGLLPDCYSSALVDPSVTSFELQDLATGKLYYARVASISDTGESELVESTPKSIIPGGVPDPILLPRIKPANDNTLVVSFEAPSDSNGAIIDYFVVESSKDPSFSSSTRIEAQPNYEVQRVTTRAHTVPWDSSSSFTLSLGDFHGDFTVPIGSDTTVRVTNGDNMLERSTGSASLSSFAARGDYILVGGMEFRVCLKTLDATPHDDTHISLCSKNDPHEVAPFISDSTSGVIDELPIFRLDTSIGAAKSPTVGDMSLNTMDALGLSQDTRSRLRRGDLIRVGHPELGETFRVSTDELRTFDDRVIPLGHVKDPATPASLSITSLQHSTYEVQSFVIRSSADSVALTSSNVLNSGYRIRFKSETSQTTTDAGSKGCLKWDGSAAALKSELESLAGIDSVKVSRQDLTANSGGVGAGVKYFITFTGDNVRGNVPPLQVVDVGINGCLDATDLGGTFKDSLAPIVVEQVEIPYIPFYEVQTTVDIPYDASSDDMKAALETLSQACTVTVSRESNRNGFSWDITFVETKQSTQSPLMVISVNGENLAALIDPQVSAIGLQQVNVFTDTQGAPYFIRVAAVNSFGIGPFAMSNPRAIEASSQPPSEPVDLFIEAMSDSELLVQWNPPLKTGGSQVTHYKVEYDALSSFTSGSNGGPYGTFSTSSSSLEGISDVQSVTVKIDNDGIKSSLYLSGTFSLNYDGQNTRQLPYNASPEDVKQALEELCVVDEVKISRSIHCSSDPFTGCMAPDGYTWLVTFISVYDVGDQHRRPTSRLSSFYSHKLSIDGSHLFECTDVNRSSCSIGGRATAEIATTQEIQQVILLGSSSFTVTIGGETSDVISLGDSLSSMEEKLNGFTKNGIGKVAATCLGCDESALSVGDSVLLHFLSFRGDLPEITVSDSDVTVSEVVKGSGQFVVGRSAFSSMISGLTSLNDWYVRVFAYNGIGEGPPAMAWPSPLRISPVAPQPPQDVSVGIETATSLKVSWNRPSSIGGVQLTNFIIEYDTTSSFTSQNGSPLGQVSVTTADADESIAIVTQAYPNSADPILRKRIVIDDADLISNGSIEIGSILVIDSSPPQQMTVSAINEESCGATCLSMEQDYLGTAATGMQVYGSAHMKHFGTTITHLIPGQEYFFRVAATNEKATGPFAYLGDSLGPMPVTPMDVPSAISWASMTPLNAGKLHIEFGPPLYEKPEGANGSPVLKYQVDIATGRNEIQELRISSSSSSFGVGSFGLEFKGQQTGCIDVNSSTEALAQALENLSTIDGIAVTTQPSETNTLAYKLEFNGPSLKNQNQPPVTIDHGAACTQALNGIEVTVVTLHDGVNSFRPEIISLTTQSYDDVSGYIELSAGYQGKYRKLIAAGNSPANFMILPGSRWVDTMGIDLTTFLFQGETIFISGELVTVREVYSDGFEIGEYHVKGTSDSPVFGYRMDNFIGAATISSGDSTIIEVSGQNLEPIIAPGEVIEVFNDIGVKTHLTVVAVTGSSLNFAPPFTGTTVTTPIYSQKKVILPANSSSAQMKSALESLPDIGSVEVTREGPNSSEGYTWYITFTSNTGTTSLSTNTETVSYISVSGIGQDCDGNYIAISYVNGRPSYEYLGKSCHVVYSTADSEWKLFSRTDTLLSTASASDINVPTSGWSNGAVIALSDNTPIELLTGQGATVDVSTLQTGVSPSFENIVMSNLIESGEPEVQELELSSTENDLGGSFELSLGTGLGTGSSTVTIYYDDPINDLQTKLQSLPGVGTVHVESRNPIGHYGVVWTITLLSNSGDVPLLQHSGTSSLQGTAVTLDIREVTKGTDGAARHMIVNNLDADETYAVRVRAMNDYGYGPYTTASQAVGGGIHPIVKTASAPPGKPSISAGRVTKSRAELKFTVPQSNGSEITSYKFEWATSTSFDSLAQAQVRVACSDESDILGSFTLIYGSDVSSRSEETVSLRIGSSTDEIKEALDSLIFLREVEVASTIESASEFVWGITFLHDVGNTGLLSVDSDNLRCQSEAETIEATVSMFPSGNLPDGYGTHELFADDSLCGSIYLAETSPTQTLILSASSGAVLGGSYQLMLDEESSACIPHDATEDQLKTAFQGFTHVKSVVIEQNAAPSHAGFPFSYEITFIGSYAYGDWPALTVNPSQFGAGYCDSFVGGSDHKAEILPVRDESLCSNGSARTVAIVADALSTLGGSFTVQFGTQYSAAISFDTTATEMETILQDLTEVSDIKVTKHNYQDFAVGMAWAITFPRQTNDDNIFRVVDTHVTGKNARVDVYPVLKLSSYSSENDSVGDFRVILDGEATAPISHQATNRKLLRELHRHNGIGKANMLGPKITESVSPLHFEALIEESFTVAGLKAIAVVGDITTAVAPGDKLYVGTCNLEIRSIEHEDYDALQSAGYLYDSLYPASTQSESAKVSGYTVLTIEPTGGSLSFTADCSQVNGMAQSVSVGSVLLTDNGVDHSVIVKSHLADLDTIEIVPENNWRGTAARLFFQPPSGLLPQTFTLDGLDKTKTYVVRASARNSEGYGPVSNEVKVTPKSTVPSSPISVSLT
eukprot:scaffold42451_cov66-Cyclotella_meneghiniana.AAC.3